MKKTTIAPALVALGSGATAASITDHLADHHVSLAVILPVIAFTLAAGLQFASDLTQTLTTNVYRCRTKGCDVVIRAPKKLGQDALDRHRNQATDHTNHAEAGTR